MKASASPSNVKSKKTFRKKHAFDAQAFLDSAGVARKVVEYRRSQKIYSQGEPAANVVYIQRDGVKLSCVNEVGKEAVVAVICPGEFFVEGCSGGRAIFICAASAN